MSGTRPEKRLLERSSVWSLGSAPSSGGSRPVMLLFCSSLKLFTIDPSASLNSEVHTSKKVPEVLWMITHTCSRLVRLAILPDRVPDKPWLGAPLKRGRPRLINGAATKEDDTGGRERRRLANQLTGQ